MQRTNMESDLHGVNTEKNEENLFGKEKKKTRPQTAAQHRQSPPASKVSFCRSVSYRDFKQTADDEFANDLFPSGNNLFRICKRSTKRRRYVFNPSQLSSESFQREPETHAKDCHESTSGVNSCGEILAVEELDSAKRRNDIRHLIREIHYTATPPNKSSCCCDNTNRVYNGVRHKGDENARLREDKGLRSEASCPKQDNDQQQQHSALTIRLSESCNSTTRGQHQGCCSRADLSSNRGVDSLDHSAEQKLDLDTRLLDTQGNGCSDKQRKVSIIVRLDSKSGTLGRILPAFTIQKSNKRNQSQQTVDSAQTALFEQDQERHCKRLGKEADQSSTGCVDIYKEVKNSTTEISNCNKIGNIDSEDSNSLENRSSAGLSSVNKISHTKPTNHEKSQDGPVALPEQYYDNNKDQIKPSNNSWPDVVGYDFSTEASALHHRSPHDLKTIQRHCERESSRAMSMQRDQAKSLESKVDCLSSEVRSDTPVYSKATQQVEDAEKSLKLKAANESNFPSFHSTGFHSPPDDSVGMKSETSQFPAMDSMFLMERYLSITPSPPTSAMKKRNSFSSASKKQKVKFDLDLEIHVVPRDSTSPISSMVSDQESDVESAPFTETDVDLDTYTVTSPSLLSEVEIGKIETQTNYRNSFPTNRAVFRESVTPFRVISRSSPVDSGRSSTALAATLHRGRRDSLDMLQMQKFLKQQARDRALGFSQSRHRVNQPMTADSSSRRSRLKQKTSESGNRNDVTINQTTGHGADRYFPRYTQFQFQRQSEEWESLRRKRQEEQSSANLLRPNSERGSVVSTNVERMAALAQRAQGRSNLMIFSNISEQLRRNNRQSDVASHNLLPSPLKVSSVVQAKNPDRGVSTEQRLPKMQQQTYAFPVTRQGAKTTRNAAIEEASVHPIRPHTGDAFSLSGTRKGGAREQVLRPQSNSTSATRSVNLPGSSGQFHFAELSEGARNVLKDAHKAYAKTCSNMQALTVKRRKHESKHEACVTEIRPPNDFLGGSRHAIVSTQKINADQLERCAGNLGRGSAVVVSSLGLTAHTRSRTGSSYSSSTSYSGRSRPLGLQRNAISLDGSRSIALWGKKRAQGSTFSQPSKVMVSVQDTNLLQQAGPYRVSAEKNPYANGARTSYDFRTSVIAPNKAL